jgi:hypothetical protein
MNAATLFAIWWVALGVALILPAAPRMIAATREWSEPATLQSTRPRYAAPFHVVELGPLVTVTEQ